MSHSAPANPAGDAPRTYALLAEFPDVDSVMSAAEKVRDAGFDQWDMHSPFPIHGADKAMGIRPTLLPWLVLGGGLAGLLGGLLLVWWTNASEVPGLPAPIQGYPYFISGKPIFSLPANIPVVFETTILLAAFGAVLGMFALNNLPMLYNPLLKSDRFRRATSDRFFIVIGADDPKFDPHATRRFLTSLGATAVEEVQD
ncbi:MAG: DUF3341 domain-containing protein [Phycisphaeraceae bacterium]|nr:DUF3341 domain-containing protein [Phycisphaeraceae bacterium]